MKEIIVLIAFICGLIIGCREIGKSIDQDNGDYLKHRVCVNRSL